MRSATASTGEDGVDRKGIVEAVGRDDLANTACRDNSKRLHQRLQISASSLQ